MGFLDDSDNSISSSLSSHGVEFGGVATDSRRGGANQKRHTICNVPSVVEGDVDQRLSSIMSLKNELGMADEESQEERIQRRLRERQEQRELEKLQKGETDTSTAEELKKMNGDEAEENLEGQRNSVSNMMEMIKQKRAQSMKNLMADSKSQQKKDSLSTSAHHAAGRIPRNSRKGRIQRTKSDSLRRTSSNDSGISASASSIDTVYTLATTTLDEDEKSELEKLKAKKERRRIKRSQSMKNPSLRRTQTVG